MAGGVISSGASESREQPERILCISMQHECIRAYLQSMAVTGSG